MYKEESIQSLDPMAHIRRRPAMYFGSIDQDGLHHILYEVIYNSVYEAIEKQCKHIAVTLYPANKVTIEDDSVAIPIQFVESMNVPLLELIFTEVVAGYHRNWLFGGWIDVGLSAVNALCERLFVAVKRDGYLWRQEYRQGNKITEVTQIRALATDEGTGTTITFTPDFTILEPNNFDYATIAKRLREVAFVMAGLTMTIHDERSKQQETFYAPNGLHDFVAYLNADRQPLGDIIHGSREVTFTPKNKNYSYTIKIEFALQYNDSAENRELGFANTTATPQGTHLMGFRTGLTRSINQFARKTGVLTKEDHNFTRKEIANGLTAVVSVFHPHLHIESQTRIRVINPELLAAVSRVVSAEIATFGKQHPEALQRIVQKCLRNRKAMSKG